MKIEDIIFRGRTKDCEWVYGDLVHLPKNRVGINGSLCVEVNPNTVGQYTGMTDKNGTKIFEGDIIERSVQKEFVGRVKPEVYEVQWRRYIGGYFLRMLSPYKDKISFCGLPHWVSDGCVVIGNIHDD